MNAININKAKQINSDFNIKEEKAQAIEMWTTPEEDYGFGYETAKFIKINSGEYGIYELVLDGEGTYIWYGIFTNGETVDFVPTHYYGD